MFAEDVGLLPGKMFQRMLEQGVKRPDQFTAMPTQLFAAMRTGGLVGFEEVAWFNGGLFDDDDAVPMDKEDIEQALKAARARLGGDRSLHLRHAVRARPRPRQAQPARRALHRPRQDHAASSSPVIVEPLTREWDDAKPDIQALLEKAGKAKSASAATKARNEAQSLYTAFLERLKRVPRARPGVRLGQLPLSRAAGAEGPGAPREPRGRGAGLPARISRRSGRRQCAGIEINPYAAELARVSVWIGEIQWMRRNGFAVPR